MRTRDKIIVGLTTLGIVALLIPYIYLIWKNVNVNATSSLEIGKIVGGSFVLSLDNTAAASIVAATTQKDLEKTNEEATTTGSFLQQMLTILRNSRFNHNNSVSSFKNNVTTLRQQRIKGAGFFSNIIANDNDNDNPRSNSKFKSLTDNYVETTESTEKWTNSTSFTNDNDTAFESTEKWTNSTGSFTENEGFENDVLPNFSNNSTGSPDNTSLFIEKSLENVTPTIESEISEAENGMTSADEAVLTSKIQSLLPPIQINASILSDEKNKKRLVILGTAFFDRSTDLQRAYIVVLNSTVPFQNISYALETLIPSGNAKFMSYSYNSLSLCYLVYKLQLCFKKQIMLSVLKKQKCFNMEPNLTVNEQFELVDLVKSLKICKSSPLKFIHP